MLKRSPIRRRGKKSLEWEKFADDYADECRDSANLINCQAKEHHPDCPRRLYRPDLHHNEGRSGKLMFDRKHLSWLSRKCHEVAHATPKSNTSWRPEPRSATNND